MNQLHKLNYILKPIHTTMKTIPQRVLLQWLMFAMLPLFIFSSCNEDENGFPITNDLRVLLVNVNDSRVESGVSGIPVTSQVEMVFSHGLNTTEFEKAISITPALDYTLAYDETNSIVTITPDVRLEYETTYTISLPKGSYGTKGESSKVDFGFEISTSEFAPPKIVLSADKLSFFEGETVTVTATLSNTIFDDVTFDLEFAGTATGGGVDYTSSVTSVIIPAGETTATFTLTAMEGDAVEGEENILITLSNVVNGSNVPPVELTLSLGDRAPALELKGVMHLQNFNAGTGTIRAVHLNVLKDIADLSSYGIEVASNGAAPNPADIDYLFPTMAVSAGDQILVIRDADAGLAPAYFDACFAEFDHVLETPRMTQNGDDAILLYNDGVAIETFGEGGVDGTGRYWEYSGSWGYKLGGNWIYGALGCSNSASNGTAITSSCVYPMCSEGLEFVGIMSLNPSVGRIRAYHLRALKDIPDLSIYGAGIASNGQATSDGVEISFPSIAVKEGESVLIIRDLDVTNASSYFGDCFATFDHLVPDGGVTSNGDDTIELFKNATLIETYGQLGVDGTGMIWDYTDSWAAKVNTVWTYGGAGCSLGAASNDSSPCPYVLCN